MTRLTKLLGFITLVAAGLGCYLSAIDRQVDIERTYQADSVVTMRGPARLRALARHAVEAGDLQRAQAAAALAVRRDPIGQGSTSLLGAILLAEGRDDLALNAYTVAAALGWRDPLTQRFWLSAAMLAGDVDVAAKRVDALLRIGENFAETESGLDFLAGSPAGRIALADRFAENPKWIYNYLAPTKKHISQNMSQRISVVSRAVHQGLKLDRSLTSYTANALVRSDMPREAYTLWNLFQNNKYPNEISSRHLYFSTPLPPPPPSPFEWSFINGPGLDTTIVNNSTEINNAALQISSRSSWRQRVARLTTVLDSGAYRISWRAITDDGAPAPWINLLVYCDAGKNELTDLRYVERTKDLNSVSFSIPQNICGSETVEIIADPSPDPAVRAARVSAIVVMRAP